MTIHLIQAEARVGVVGSGRGAVLCRDIMLLHVSPAGLYGSRVRQLIAPLVGRTEEFIDELHRMALLKAYDQAADDMPIVRRRASWRPEVDEAARGWSGGRVGWGRRGIGGLWRLDGYRRGCAATVRHVAADERQAQDSAKSDKRDKSAKRDKRGHSSHRVEVFSCERGANRRSR